ncbi:hypothetical protein KR222_002244, partial [Zaprionus bogoriensis]
TQQLQVPRPRGRIRIGSLPAPHSPPAGPVSGIMPGLGWPSYAAVAPGPVTSTVHTHIPLLREPSVPAAAPSDAVVYGNWKPEHPLKPDEHDTPPKQRIYGRLEAMLMGLPAEAMDRRDVDRSDEVDLEPQLEQEERTASSGYNPYARRESFEHSQESRGRWRVPTPSGMDTQSQRQPLAGIEVVRLNATDPLLRAMAKQINESIETTTPHRQRTQTTEDTWMPLPYPYPTHSYESTQPVLVGMKSSEMPTLQPKLVPESTTIALNWPTDFLDPMATSTEQSFTNSGQSIDRIDHVDSIDRIDEDLADQSDDYKFYEESLNSAQTHNELSIPETLIPQLPLNITRVGIPFEDRNSAEEPTICVPLTVTETASESATPVMVEVERVYCFPLPKVEIRTGNIREQHQPAVMEQE